MMAPMNALELHYPMIQFLIIRINPVNSHSAAAANTGLDPKKP